MHRPKHLIEEVRDACMSDTDCASVVAATAKQDSEHKEVAARMGLEPSALSAQGMLETLQGLGSFGGKGILIPVQQEPMPGGGGFDPAAIVQHSARQPTEAELAVFANEEAESIKRVEDAADAEKARSNNADRPLNNEITTLF